MAAPRCCVRALLQSIYLRNCTEGHADDRSTANEEFYQHRHTLRKLTCIKEIGWIGCECIVSLSKMDTPDPRYLAPAALQGAPPMSIWIFAFLALLALIVILGNSGVIRFLIDRYAG